MFYKDQHDGNIAKCEMGNSLYLNLESISEKALNTTEVESDLWHKRLGHYNLSSLKFMKDENMAENFPQIIVHSQPCFQLCSGKVKQKTILEFCFQKSNKTFRVTSLGYLWPYEHKILGQQPLFCGIYWWLQQNDLGLFLKAKIRSFSSF